FSLRPIGFKPRPIGFSLRPIGFNPKPIGLDLKPINTIFKWIVLLFALLISLSSFSQTKSHSLNIQLVDTIHKEDFNKIKKQLTSQKIFSDSFSVKKELQQIILKLNNSGYLAASF